MKAFGQGSDVVGELWINQILVDLPVTKVLRGARNKAVALGLQYLEPPDVGAGSRPPGGARVIHQGADEPSQAKVQTEGGDLREAQVDISPSGSHSCV